MRRRAFRAPCSVHPAPPLDAPLTPLQKGPEHDEATRLLASSCLLHPPPLSTSFEMLRLALLLVAAYGVSAQPCEDGWRYSPSSHACYKLIGERLPWVISEYKCLYQGAHHVSIKDYEENAFVTELARQAGEVWLGAAQFGRSTAYEWPDHSVFSYENWNTGSRPAFNTGKRCVKMDGTGRWIQSCCKIPAAIICEKPASSALDDFRHRHRL